MRKKIYGILITTFSRAHGKFSTEADTVQKNCSTIEPFSTDTDCIARLADVTTDYEDYVFKRTKHNFEATRQAESKLRDSLANLVPALEKIAQGDRSLLNQTGFKLRKIRVPVTEKPGPAIGGGGRSSPEHSGVAHLYCDPMTNATSYDAKVSLSLDGPWEEKTGLTNSQDMRFEGLLRLKDYFGQICVNNTAGKGDFCAPFGFTVY